MRASRTKRRRRRNRHFRQPKALAHEPAAGGWGQGAPIYRRDLLLVRQSIREGWPTSPEVRKLVARDVVNLTLATDSTKMAIAGFRAILAMMKDNLRAQHSEIEHD